MTDQQRMLSNFTPFATNSRWINGIGGARAAVLGKGNIHIVTSVNGVRKKHTISDVLYAPSIGINLFSVGAVTAEGGEVHFTESQAFIERHGTLDMTATRIDNKLYRLDITVLRDNEAFIARPLQRSLQDWHQTIGHISYSKIIEMANKEAVLGLKLITGSQPPTTRCHDCAIGKMHRLSFSKSTTNTTHIGALVHSDVCGPMQVNSLKGARYYISFRDDFSGFRVVYFIKEKTEVPECCRNFIALLHTQTGQLVISFRTDGGTEYLPLDPWLKKKGIRHETTVRFTPQQNGKAERDNRTIVEGARTLLYSNKALPLQLWAEAVNCMVYVLNRSLSTVYHSKTPFETWYGRKPDISNLRTFGSEFYVLIPKELRRKLDAKGLLCFFVGNTDDQKGDRYWDPTSGKINISRDVSAISHHYVSRLPRPDLQNGIDVFLPNNNMPPATPAPAPAAEGQTIHPVVVAPPPVIEDTIHPVVVAPPPAIEVDDINMQPENVDGHSRSGQEQIPHLIIDPPNRRHPGSPPPPGRVRVLPRTSARIRERRALDSAHPALHSPSDYLQVASEYMAMSGSLLSEELEPNHYKDAMASKQAPEWTIATKQEFDSLMKNGSWILVPLPPNRSLIDSRWTFKIKPGRQHQAKIYKARFVAKGFSQVAGVDYTETEIYAPVVKLDSLRILLRLCLPIGLVV